jgi:hypothetical protein
MKTPTTVLALNALLCPLAMASTGSTEPDRFAELDSALSQLTATTQTDDPLRFGALLRAYYDNVEDELTLSGDDISGFRIYDAQVWVHAQVGAYEVFVKMDAGETDAFPPVDGDGVTDFELRDAWAKTGIAENFHLYWGQFKCPLVASGNVGDGNLAMIDRTRIGRLFSMPGAYQPGAALTADFEAFHVKLAVQNGADGSADEFGMVARAEFQLNDGAKHREGALGAEGTDGTIGIGYFQDDSQVGGEDFGSAIALDAYLTMDAFSFHGEVLAADEELAANAVGNTTEDATLWAATVGYLFGDGKYEGFLRYQDLDNEVDATLVGGGLNYYVNGHATKWQVNVSQYDDDNADGMILQLGLAIGIGEPAY